MSYYTATGKQNSLRYGFDIQPYKFPVTIKSPPVPKTISLIANPFNSGLASLSFPLLRKNLVAHAPQPSKTISYNGTEFV